MSSRRTLNAQNDLGYLLDAAKAFQKQPEGLTLAFNTYFRMQAVEQQIDSAGGRRARRYQNPAMGDALVSALADNSPNRDKAPRLHCRSWPSPRNRNSKIADTEAQRCRTELSYGSLPLPVPRRRRPPPQKPRSPNNG